MSHFVPDFEMENEDDSLPTASADTVPHPLWKSSLPEDEIIELLWHGGQLVMQSQNQRSAKKPAPGLAATTQSHRYSATDAQLPTDSCEAREIRSSQSQIQMEQQQRQHMFMQEDEMISWLHYPMVDEPPLETNFCADLLYSSTAIANNTSNSSDVAATASPVVTATTGPPVHLSRNTELSQPSTTTVAAEVSARRPPIPPSRSTIPNFAHFSRHNVKARAEPSVHLRQPSISKTAVDSNETPAMARPSGISEIRKNSADVDPTRVAESSAVNAQATITSSAGWTDVTPREVKLTSSPGASSASAEPIRKAPTEDRKRKGREPEDCEEYSEDVDFESLDAKKQPRGSTSTKKSRASEVHNLSERRRRDRINEKMRALQELIPRCNKSDKASMLDEAIEYLKSLQLQVQMMSMGCGMVPMMLPGFPHYMPTMEMGIGMGMGMEMEMGMNRAVMPFSNVLAGPAFPAPAATAHYGPRFFTPPFPMPLVPPPGSSRTQATTQADHILTSLASPDPNQSRSTTLSDPYQQYLGPYQMQLQSTQNQAMNQPSLSKPTTSKPNENGEIRQPAAMPQSISLLFIHNELTRSYVLSASVKSIFEQSSSFIPSAAPRRPTDLRRDCTTVTAKLIHP